MASDPGLKEIVDKELRSRRGIFGDSMSKLIEYLQGRLDKPYSKKRLNAAVNSLIADRKVVRKRFRPMPVAVSVSAGEDGVIVYHAEFKDSPESDFPEEFQDFMSKHHGLAAAA
jgi:hypothetical protein